MNNLVNYGSDSDGESRDGNNERVETGGRDLTSEWEAFENSILDSGGTSSIALPAGVPPPPAPPVALPKESSSEAHRASSEESDRSSSGREDENGEEEEEHSSAESSEHGSSEEEGDEDESSGEEDDEEEEGSSDESSNDSGDDDDVNSDVSDDKHEPRDSPSRKRKNSHDDVIKNRFRSPSPEDKKAKVDEVEHKQDKEHKGEKHEVAKRDEKKSTEKERRSSHKEEDRHHSSTKHESKSSSHHGRSSETTERRRRRRSRSRDHRSRHSRHSKSSRDERKKRSRSRERKDSRSKHSEKRVESRRSKSGRRGRRRGDSDRRRGKRRSRSRDKESNRRRRSPHRHSGNKRSRSKSPLVGKVNRGREKMKLHLMQGQTAEEVMKKHLAAGGSIDPKALLMKSSLTICLKTGQKITPQEAVRQQMEAMQQKAQELTGIAVPKYYNPAAVNPLKYAEQVQKRKLLWSKNKEKKEDTPQPNTQQQQLWQATSFGADKVDEKFRKLMGVKGDTAAGAGEASQLTTEQLRKQQELFSQLDKEYMMARMTTHTHRGIGLGAISFNVPQPQPPTEAATSSTSQQPPPK